MAYDLERIIGRFSIDGRLVGTQPYGCGHINDTWVGWFETAGGPTRYIHQRINHQIFRKPAEVMENVRRVTTHLQEKIRARGGDPRRESLTLVPTRDGALFHQDDDGNTWRTYLFIEGARSHENPERPSDAFEAARAFGAFQRDLADLGGERLFETIPRFHDTPKRVRDFLDVLDKDPLNRARGARAEIDFVLARQVECGQVVRALAEGTIPERVTHNDTKLNNVMMDETDGRAICVIDLDTVMPGSAVYDFGDAVRIGASTAPEDERDLARVGIDLGLFERLAHGYLDAARAFLTPREIALLAFSARLLTFECGTRFLTDHLAGDVYFKVHREGHNLDRARTQLKMVREMEARAGEMEAIVRRYA